MKPNINSEEFKNAVSVRQMRESDKYTINNLVPGKELMLRAAKGIFDSAKWQDKKIAIVCGSGNNAGDGYALAELIIDTGTVPTLIRLSDKFSDDGKYYYDIAIEKGVKDKVYNETVKLDDFDIIVDCIFGTGFKGMPEGIAVEAIKNINSSGAYVICADINSGINGDTGEALLAVKSDLTVSIGFFKKGMFLGDAPKLIKELTNVDIGIILI